MRGAFASRSVFVPRRELILPDKTLILRDQLKLYLPLDEGDLTGTSSRFDESGNGNNFTNINGVTSATGQVGGAGLFTATSSQYLSIPSNPTLQVGGGDFTVACWFRSTDVASQRTLIGKFNHSSIGEFWFHYGSATLRLTTLNGTAQSTVATAAVLANNIWHFVAARYRANDNNVVLTVNNTNISATTTVAPVADTTNVTIGARSSASLFHNGEIDEISLWNCRLNSGELDMVHQRGIAKLRMINKF